MDKYILKGRDNSIHNLIRQGDMYYIDTLYPIRISEVNNSIESVDLSSGPYLSIGTDICGNIIKKFEIINNKVFIKF
mgnify:CR=1 FL=1